VLKSRGLSSQLNEIPAIADNAIHATHHENTPFVKSAAAILV